MSLTYEWIKSSASEDIPRDAVYAGIHSDGSNIYVGRAYHAGNLLPAKIISKRKSYKKGAEVYCAVSYNKSEITITNFEVLCGLGPFEWVEDKDGNVPAHAIPAGKTALGEKLYVGRDCVNGAITCGKIQPSRGRLFIPYGGKEHESTNYEVLVTRNQEIPETPTEESNLKWVSATSLSEAPLGAIKGGFRSDDLSMYVGRCDHNGQKLVAKAVPSWKRAYYYHEGKEHEKTNYEILCGENVAWVPASNGGIPPNAVACGQSSNGESLYIGRGWSHGDLTVGTINPAEGVLRLPKYGQQVCKEYEVMIEIDL